MSCHIHMSPTYCKRERIDREILSSCLKCFDLFHFLSEPEKTEGKQPSVQKPFLKFFNIIFPWTCSHLSKRTPLPGNLVHLFRVQLLRPASFHVVDFLKMCDFVDIIQYNRLSLNLYENASTADREVDVISIGDLILAYCRRNSLLQNKMQTKSRLIPCHGEMEKPVLM